MGRKLRKNDYFDYTLLLNQYSFKEYLTIIENIALSRFDWSNVPPSIDVQFLERQLFNRGFIVFFEDEVMGPLALDAALSGRLDVYNIPITRRIRASNGYRATRDKLDSVIIWNDFTHKNSYTLIKYYAMRLYQLDSIIDVNAHAQRTPILITTPNNQRMVMENLYLKFAGGTPVIYGDNDLLNINNINVLKTDAPYVADRIFMLKSNLWAELLTFLGIANVSINKKEKLVQDEVLRSQGGTFATRNSYVKARQIACEQINRMFGLDIWVEFSDMTVQNALENAVDTKITVESGAESVG